MPDVCTWGGVTCIVSSATAGSGNVVLELSLLFLDLSGALPPELGEATQLRAMEMGGNSLFQRLAAACMERTHSAHRAPPA
jgi:hypothetical protein